MTDVQLLPPANVVCEGYVFTPVCDSVNRGRAWLLGGCIIAPRGGMHGCSGGAYMVAPGGHVWLLPGGPAWLLPGGHAWLLLGGHVWLLLGGMHGSSGVGGHVWDMTRYGDTVNERAVRILLECILVT